MNKLTFYDYFPQKKTGRPPITQINILQYLSRYGKARRTKITKYFGKKNQEINDAINKLVGQNLVTNYCDVCKIGIENYDLWKHHKKNKKHKTNLKIIKKDESIEKTKPLIIATKKGLEVMFLDPVENREYNYDNGDKLQKVVWGVITTKQFWNVLTEIFYNLDDIKNLEYLCKVYENNILEIFRENILPYYFRDTLQEFKDTNNNLWLLQEIKQEEIFFEDKILKAIAHNKSLKVSKLNIIKQIEKSYKCNIKLFEKQFKRLLSKGIIEKISKKNHDTFQITHLGLILLFHHLNANSVFYTKPPPEFKKIIDSIRPSKKLDKELFFNDFERIRKKYSYLLPRILDDENFHKLNLKKIGFLKIFDELYFSDKESVFGEHNFDNFRKFYEIREVDFGKKFDNYITSFSLSKLPQDEFFKKMTSRLESKSKKSIKDFLKILDSETDYRKNLVYIKNTSDRLWTTYYPADMLFDKVQYENDDNYPLRNQLSIKFKNQIESSIENKITFDFYSLFGKYYSDLSMNFNNNKIEEWYEKQLEQLSEYVSNYFDKIML